MYFYCYKVDLRIASCDYVCYKLRCSIIFLRDRFKIRNNIFNKIELALIRQEYDHIFVK